MYPIVTGIGITPITLTDMKRFDTQMPPILLVSPSDTVSVMDPIPVATLIGQMVRINQRRFNPKERAPTAYAFL